MPCSLDISTGFLWSTLRMSIRTPPTLLQLAGESLLRDQASAIAALEHLPAELFPQLFALAFRGRRCSSLTAITQAWPFTVLPLGGLNEPPPVQVFKAVLDGLDVLLAQEVRPRRWKLRVLDLRYLGFDFWKIWCGDSTQKHWLTGPVTEHRSSPSMEHPLAPVEVFLDLDFNKRDTDEFVTSVIQWARRRKGLLHLCCKKLKIVAVPFRRARKVLDAVQLDCIQEVELNCAWSLITMETFALYMRKMPNLQKLFLSHIRVLREEEDNEEEEQDWEEDEEEEEQEEQEEQDWEKEEQERETAFAQLLSQMLSSRHLRELDLDAPYFLRGRLHQMLRCLQAPLETLTVSRCLCLTDSDLEHLFQCPNLRQLKSLRLYCASLTGFIPELLRALLEAVAPTLQKLYLEKCAIVDSQVEAILPVLSRCHQLSELTIIENSLSVATVGKLLRHTAGLRSLEEECYPVPRECYTTQDTVSQETLALVLAELTGILRELGRPRTIQLATEYMECYDVEL
ncbi:PRAME family member 15 [Pipistrellus kuhlii]|uniref:PRAME family member 15 n=1 Tax=Pipistrellus kuhlii TaxID=59472 RepID=UPI00174F48FF|nr:PRAME family member 15 [Pipistrellus kuhlii]